MRWILLVAMIPPVTAAIGVTVTHSEPDWGTIALTALNAFPATGLSPFARAPLFMPGHYPYNEFERAALGIATARADAGLAALMLMLILAAAWASVNGAPIALGPRGWLLWAAAVTTLFTTLPAFIAEVSIPMPQEHDA